MKIFKKIAFFMATLFFVVSCSQYELVEPVGEASGQQNEQKSNVDIGGIFIQSIEYVLRFSYIEDPAEYDPFIFSETGVKDFSTNVKLINRIEHFYDSLGYPIDRRVLTSAFNTYPTWTEQHYINANGNVDELRYALELGDLLENPAAKLTDVKKDCDDLRNVIESDSNLSAQSIENLLLGLDIVTTLLEVGIANGGISVDDIDTGLPGMPCGWAAALYAASFVGLCLATGGLGIACGLIGFGGGIAGVIEGC